MPANSMVLVPLYRLAHGRTGDKGDISNISVIAWRPELYSVLEEQLSTEAVTQWFAHRRPRRVKRYLVPSIGAMNFVLEGVLDGGVNKALNLDTHGKSLSFHLLDFPVRVSDELASTLPNINLD